MRKEEEDGMPPEVDRDSMDKPMLQRGAGPTMNAQVDQPVPLAGQGPMGAIATDKPASPEDGGPVEVAWVADVGRPGPVAGTGSAQHQAIGEIVAYYEDAEDVTTMVIEDGSSAEEHEAPGLLVASSMSRLAWLMNLRKDPEVVSDVEGESQVPAYMDEPEAPVVIVRRGHIPGSSVIRS